MGYIAMSDEHYVRSGVFFQENVGCWQCACFFTNTLLTLFFLDA